MLRMKSTRAAAASKGRGASCVPFCTYPARPPCSDPNGAMLAFADMMRKQIVMPAHLMDDGRHAGMNSGRNLFEDFSGGCMCRRGKGSP